MSLYNALFGNNSGADIILATLGLKQVDCGRFRDAYVKNGTIVIHTRNGGGNREDYQDTLDALAKHPNWLGDADDDFDCTYADITFSFPEAYKAELEAMDKGDETVTPSDKWQALFASLGKQ